MKGANNVNVYLEQFIKAMEPYAPNISKEHIESVLQVANLKELKKGEILVHIGDIPKELYFIISGLIRSYYIDMNGNDVTRYFITENSFCCAEMLLMKEPFNCCFEALEDCRLICFDGNNFKSLITGDVNYMKAYIKALEQSIIYKIGRENSFLLKSAVERYLDFKKKYVNLEERVHQSHIASYLGITPVSLSRIRRTIKEEN